MAPTLLETGVRSTLDSKRAWNLAVPLRPVPCPGALVVKNGSKRFFRTSCVIPQPVSLIGCRRPQVNLRSLPRLGRGFQPTQVVRQIPQQPDIRVEAASRSFDPNNRKIIAVSQCFHRKGSSAVRGFLFTVPGSEPNSEIE